MVNPPKRGCHRHRDSIVGFVRICPSLVLPISFLAMVENNLFLVTTSLLLLGWNGCFSCFEVFGVFCGLHELELCFCTFDLVVSNLSTCHEPSDSCDPSCCGLNGCCDLSSSHDSFLAPRRLGSRDQLDARSSRSSSKLFGYKRHSCIQWVMKVIDTMVKFMIATDFIPATSNDPMTLFEDATCFDPVINFVLRWSFWYFFQGL